MGNYEQLIQSIRDVIRQNGNNEITGQALQTILVSMVNVIGGGSTFGGVALPTTNPGRPDGNKFFLFSKPGTYTYFGGTQVSNKCLGYFVNQSGSWVGYYVINSFDGGAQVDIVDNLTSERTDAALSARQGKVLNDKIGQAISLVDEINGEMV